MKKFALTFVFLIFGVIFSHGQFVKEMTVENNQIPPEFSEFEGTLLIVSQYKAWDKYARKAFDKNYKGKYKFMTKKEKESDYSDIETYRYIIRPKFSSSPNSAPGSRIGSSHTSGERLVILDRKTGKEYSTRNTAFYGKLLKSFAEALEIERSK